MDELDESILQRVTECLDRMDREGPGALDEVCAEHPEQAGRIRSLVGRLRDVGMMDRDDLTKTLRVLGQSGADSAPPINIATPKGATLAAGTDGTKAGEAAFDGGRVGDQTRYVLKGEVARGGMGSILRVFDRDLRRELAMKVALTPEVPFPSEDEADSRALARFLEEAQITGQLEHPGIVPVHELGLDSRGRLFFTMPLVRGDTFKQIIDNVRDSNSEWTRTRALGVLQRVCDAVAFAHERGVLHRDLKPGNIMVGRHGETYVMDWGLARVLGTSGGRDIRPRGPEVTDIRTNRSDPGGDTPDSPLLTFDGDVLGTPAYMPPEQAAGNISELGPPADVYAVGAILYHLLCGHPPYAPAESTVSAMSLLERVRTGPPAPIENVAIDVAPELAAICQRAMARRPADRYVDMSGLSDDLRAFMEQRVVRAYATGPWSELKKWRERNRALAFTLSLGFALVLGLTAWALIQRQVAIDKGKEAKNNASEMEKQRDRARNAERDALDAKAAAQAAEEVSRQSADRTRFQAAMIALDLGDREEASRLLAEVPPDISRLERQYVELQLDQRAAHFSQDTSPITVMRWSDDGPSLAVGTRDGRLSTYALNEEGTFSESHHRLSLPQSVRQPPEPNLDGAIEIRSIAWNANRDRLLVGLAGGPLLLVDPTKQGEGAIQSLPSTADTAIIWVGFNSVDEPLSLDADGALRLHHASGTATIAQRYGGGTPPVHLSNDRTTVWITSPKNLVSVDATNPSQQRTIFDRGNDTLFIDSDPEDTYLVAYTRSGIKRQYDAATGDVIHEEVTGTPDDAAAISFRMGRMVVAERINGRPGLRDPFAAPERNSLLGSTGETTAVEFSSDGALIAAGSNDGSVSMWRTDTATTRDLNLDFDRITAAAFDSTGSQLACAISFDQVDIHPVVVLDTSNGSTTRTALLHREPVQVLAFHPDGNHVASASRNGRIWIWDTRSGESEFMFTCDGVPDSLAFVDNGETLLVGPRGEPIQRYRTANGSQIRDLDQQGPVARALGSDRIVAVQQGTVVTGPSENLVPVSSSESPPETPIAVAISANSAWIAASFPDRSVHVWATDGSQHRRIQSDQAVERIQFMRNGTRLSCARDGRVMVVDLEDGDASLVWSALLSEDRESDHLIFSEDGLIAFWSGRTKPKLLHGDPKASFAFTAARGRDRITEKWVKEKLRSSGDPQAVLDAIDQLRPELRNAASLRVLRILEKPDPLASSWSIAAWKQIEPDLPRDEPTVALQQALRAVQSAPNHAGHRRLLAWTLLMTGDLAAAQTEAELAARLDRATSNREPTKPQEPSYGFASAIREIAQATSSDLASGRPHPAETDGSIARWLYDSGLEDALAAVRAESLIGIRQGDPEAETRFAQHERLLTQARETTLRWNPAPPPTEDEPNKARELYQPPTTEERVTLAGALGAAEQANELIPWNADSLHVLGLARYRIGQVDLALDAFQRADQQNESSPNPYPRVRDIAFQAMCHWRLTRSEDSLRHFRELIGGLEPSTDDPESVAALEELDWISAPPPAPTEEEDGEADGPDTNGTGPDGSEEPTGPDERGEV